MSDTGSLARLEREVVALPAQEQLRLVKHIMDQLRKSGAGEKRDLDWDELYGAGKSLWEGEDAQDYVNRVREDRECP
ncbi:MAG: hypothetical protein FJ291_11515 [Planctomycetes bacterium]|nr:hypothetical protein [Planctomycetota bacterium]